MKIHLRYYWNCDSIAMSVVPAMEHALTSQRKNGVVLEAQAAFLRVK